jgi:hypothetical protein
MGTSYSKEIRDNMVNTFVFGSKNIYIDKQLKKN